MLRSKKRTIRQKNAVLMFSINFVSTALAIIIHTVDSQLQLGVSIYTTKFFTCLIILMLFIQCVIWFVRNKGYKGLKFAFNHYLLIFRLRKAFLDATYYNNRVYLGNEVARLPKIKIDFHQQFSKGTLYVQNININKDISNVNITFALNNFIVDSSYLSDDENYYIFEIYDSNLNEQLSFKNIDDLKLKSISSGEYSLFIDKSTIVPLQGTLIVGQTGSGKTYAIYSFILQMLTKTIKYQLYFADPKNSSLAIFGEKISSKYTAVEINEIINLLRLFNDKMNNRKLEIKRNLDIKLEGSYSDFNYKPHIFIFDEFASFQSALQTMEKKNRDEVTSLLTQVVLQGRQLGFFLFIVMQKSDATLLPTNLRENLPVKIVLGNAERQTYITAFGTGVDIPNKDFDLGQGLYTCPTIANTPKVCHFSYLDFDIMTSLKSIK